MTPEDNEILTRVGPGTPMGAVLRRYWLPVLESEALGPADGPPQRVRLLGEDLVAFRDTAGRAALLAEACPHRRASLFLGRNEHGGIRCVYHGWKFDADGGCLEMPTEPSGSRLREGVRAPAHACREENGIVWAFLGARPGDGSLPPLPELGWALAPPSRRGAFKYLRACNWLQALEGDIDTAHLGWLHTRFRADGSREVAYGENDRLRDVATRDTQPVLHLADTPAGLTVGARREYDGAGDYWRITQFLMPIFTSVPSIGAERRAKAFVPLDDENTLVWEPNWRTGEDLPATGPGSRGGRVPPSGMLPDGPDPLEQGRIAASRENDYFLDRNRQRTVNFTGLEESPPVQDAAVQESMGRIVDRSREHLGTSDAAIIRVRQILLETARRVGIGEEPPGARDPGAYRLRGCQMVLPREADWRAASREEQKS